MTGSLTIIPEDRLPSLAAQINAAHDMASRSAQAAITHAIAVGEGLIEAKSLVDHGQWLPWLTENFDFSERTAQDYMRLAKHRDEVQSNPQRVADLPIREALKAIRKARPVEPNPDPAFDVPLVPAQIAPPPDDDIPSPPRTFSASDINRGAFAEIIGVDAVAMQTEIDELREYAAALERDVAELKAENKKFEEMRLQWERGGFQEIIADKDEQIRVLNTRVSAESREKRRNLNSMEWWKAKAIDLGYSRDVVIPLDEPAGGAA